MYHDLSRRRNKHTVSLLNLLFYHLVLLLYLSSRFLFQLVRFFMASTSLAHRPSQVTFSHIALPNINSVASVEDEKYWLSQSIPRDYLLECATHSGTNGHVAIAYAVKLLRRVAIKRVSAQRCQLIVNAKEDCRPVPREYDILNRIYHPGIVQVFDLIPEVRRQPRYYDIVMELGPYGDLHDCLTYQTQRHQQNSLSLLHCFTSQLIDVLHYLHTVVGVVHGDLKMENILIQDWETKDQCPCSNKRQSNGICTGRRFQLCDFGAAVRIKDDDGKQCDLSSHRYRFQGTEQSISPETIMKQQSDGLNGTTQDMWSFGCLIYEVLANGVPAYPNLLKMSPQIVRQFWQIFDVEASIREIYTGPKAIPEELMTLLKGLLTVDYKKRWTIQECLQSAWNQ